MSRAGTSVPHVLVCQRKGRATPILDVLASKYGMSQAQAQQAEMRLAALAEAEGLEFTVDRAMGNTFDAHRLVHLGREHGIQERVRRSFITRTSARAGPYSEAGRLGISGVPFCVLGGKYGVSGAQPTETFTEALRQAWDSRSGH